MQNDRDLVNKSIYTSLKTHNIGNYKHMKHALKTKDMSQMINQSICISIDPCTWLHRQPQDVDIVFTTISVLLKNYSRH